MVKVLFLAVLQGVAEFLPVSSSGHLVIAQHLLGVKEPGMRLDICLHVGTLASIFVFYAKPIGRILAGCFLPSADAAVRRESWMFAAKILLSAIPAVIVYFCFADRIKGMFENARMVGALLMFTGAVLVGTRYLPSGGRDVGFLRAFAMGAGQALAMLPGVSRSGMTLACARGGRVDPEKSAEFSFLMSAPLIVGALLLELKNAFAGVETDAEQLSWWVLGAGMAVSAVVGFFSLKLLVRTLKSSSFWMFGPYCLAAGLATLVFVH